MCIGTVHLLAGLSCPAGFPSTTTSEPSCHASVQATPRSGACLSLTRLHRQLSGVSTDDLDLRYSWISDKLHSAGYDCYWYGKGHTGYKSMKHLPTSHGFKHFMGFLSGSQSYTAADRWEDTHPVQQDSEFVNPPPNCGGPDTGEGSRRLEEGTTCTLSHKEDFNYTCTDSNPRRVTTTDCCAACQADANCSHFVQCKEMLMLSRFVVVSSR